MVVMAIGKQITRDAYLTIEKCGCLTMILLTVLNFLSMFYIKNQ